MADADRGRYYAERVRERAGGSGRRGRKEWHLVGVSDPPGEHLVLFWDTTRTSYGGSQYDG